MMKLSYYRVNKIFWIWKRCEGEDGCEIVLDATLSIGKAPPPLPALPKKPEPPKPRPKRLTHKDRVNNAFDGLLAAAEGISRFKKWLNTPDPPKEGKPAPVTKREKESTVAPFDIQEIPGAMRKIYLPKSAALMER